MCLWCAYKEDVFNFLLICPRFAALRTSMVASIMLARRSSGTQGTIMQNTIMQNTVYGGRLYIVYCI